MIIIVFPIWWWFNFLDFFRTNKEVCATGWNLLDYLNYLLVALSITPIAFFASIFLLCLICFSPCIFKEIRQYRQNETARRNVEQAQTATFMGSLTKMIYDPEKFKEYTECIICSETFDKDASITPLPCNIKHYFHNHCITQWLETKKECPLCRHKITIEELTRFKGTVDIMLKEREESFAAEEQQRSPSWFGSNVAVDGED